MEEIYTSLVIRKTDSINGEGKKIWGRELEV